MRRILLAEGAVDRGSLSEILALARKAKVRVERRRRAELDARARSRAHQGVIAEVDEYRFRSWREGVELAQARREAPMLLALDGITDPQNLGSLLRSAEVFGTHAVIISSRRSAPITPVVEKAAAGALEHLIVDRVASLDRALADCRTSGLWIIGLAGDAPTGIHELELLAEPIVLVVGGEGKGISRLVRDRADQIVSIPMTGRTSSLNAAIAGAIALYEARSARPRR